MRRSLVPALILAGALGACSSPSGPPADRTVYRVEEAPPPRLDEATTPGQPMAHKMPKVEEMTEAERMAWFQTHGIYPYPWYPAPDGQSLGYVHEPTDWGWVLPTILTAGALYGLYRAKRHYDWW
jgi:hypothetical protein